MTIRPLPTGEFERPKAYQGDMRADVLQRWKPLAAEADETATISIYDAIGQDYFTGEGITAKRVAGALRSVGKNPVTVNVNSPGGDMFEGLAIYNLLREHPAEVTVRVMGMAASAASIIAMAGDTIEMGLGSFLMIHNSWGMVVGNQNDMRDAAAVFAEFDAAMVDIYAARTGAEKAEIANMMGAETWLRTDVAIAQGFADATFDSPEYETHTDTAKSARAVLDATLARAGLPRSERRRLLREAASTPCAAGAATPCAGFDVDAAKRLLSEITA